MVVFVVAVVIFIVIFWSHSQTTFISGHYLTSDRQIAGFYPVNHVVCMRAIEQRLKTDGI